MNMQPPCVPILGACITISFRLDVRETESKLRMEAAVHTLRLSRGNRTSVVRLALLRRTVLAGVPPVLHAPIILNSETHEVNLWQKSRSRPTPAVLQKL